MSADEISANEPQELSPEAQAALEELSLAAKAIDLELMVESMKCYVSIHKKRGNLVRKIPSFWAQTVMNSTLVTFLDSEDADAFSYLEDLDIEYPQLEKGDPRPVRMSFTFGPNPYFSDKVLVKEFTIKPDAPPLQAEFDLTEVGQTTPTPIDWKDDEHNIAKKNPQFKSSDDEDFDPGSFFSHFFQGTDIKVVGPVATALVVDLWPNALGVYTGTHENASVDPFNDSDLEVEEEDDADEDEDDEDGDFNAAENGGEEEERPQKRGRAN